MWNERYSEAEYVFGTEPNDFLKEQFEQIPTGGRVLCWQKAKVETQCFWLSKVIK